MIYVSRQVAMYAFSHYSHALIKTVFDEVQCYYAVCVCMIFEFILRVHLVPNS